jgi:alpha-L-fucosidase
LNKLIRELQPGIFINDRGWSEGDFSTPEREYQAAGSQRFIRMTEACNSVGQQSWGYRTKENFYSKGYLCSAIDRYMALGASYLLNVGPDGNGVITAEYAQRLLAVGNWYRRMQGCLCGHEEDSFDYAIMGSPCIATKKEQKTYLHFYEGMIADGVTLGNYPFVPKQVRLMNTGESLPFEEAYLPSFYDGTVQSTKKKGLHICGISVDSVEGEPIVIEIQWN